MKRLGRKACLCLIASSLWALLTGCVRLLPQSGTSPESRATLLLPTTTPSLLLPTPLPPVSASTEAPVTRKITVWLPPQFDPSASNPAGVILQERLQSFAEQHGDLQVETRMKALDGPGGLLDSLSAASAAAPLALPDLVALPRPLLEITALKGLVYPLDGLTEALSAPDWYGFARQLAVLQSSTFGLPFAGDALLLAYRPELVARPPVTWKEPFPEGSALIFPAADPNADFTLLLYQAAGGKIEDDQGRPMLDVDILTRVLAYYQGAAQASVLPAWLTQYENEDQAWDAFLSRKAPMTVAWSSQYLLQKMKAEPVEAGLIPVPEDRTSYTLATGWVWAVAGSQPEHRKLGIQLAEYLLDEAFLARWTEALGILPPRQGALQAWQDGSARQLAERLATTAVLYPSVDIRSSLGPTLKQATIEVLKQEKDPAAAAQAAVDRLQAP